MYFEPIEQWIWLPRAQYPDRQNTILAAVGRPASLEEGHYTVVRCKKSWETGKPIREVTIRSSADTFFRLFLNEKQILSGPAAVGGDFISNERARPQHYATTICLKEHPGFSEGKLDFSAMVRMMPIKIFEYSQGHGGFFLTAQVRFEDGTKTTLVTDESWKIQLLPAYRTGYSYDETVSACPAGNAVRIQNLWHCNDSPIPTMTETKLFPEGHLVSVLAGECVQAVLPLDMIYTGYPAVSVKASGVVRVSLRCVETDEVGTAEQYVFTGSSSYQSFTFHSAGKLCVEICNESDAEAVLDFAFVASHFPVAVQAVTRVSDPDLNLVLDVCTHTLKYCRQTLHLDSGRHCEPLACTGDYYIEALMTMFTYGDQRLSAFDIRRTAQLLRYNNGRMFHTTYSLIWVQMLWDVYMLTGEKALLTDCEEALTMLFERFETYLGDNGLIETPPDYMFIDWLYPDAISTHHPPKALGQTCLNLFYYGALKTADRVYREIGEPVMAQHALRQSEKMQKAICAQLFDPEKELFFEGLNTPTPEHLLGKYMPQNVEKRYYRQHANILAAYFGVLTKEQCRMLIDKVMNDTSLGEIQPYFTHFLLEAVYRNDLRERYTLEILERWKQPIKECPYGLAEGFVKPEPTYHFDHSHAWGGTPAYSLPLALTGIELLEPGWRSVRFAPSLLGLSEVSVQIPTPFGMINVQLEQGKEPVIEVPQEITVQ